MRTVSIFINGNNRAVRIPKDLDFDETVTELQITKEGDTITLKPIRPTWGSFFEEVEADPEIAVDRTPLIKE
ncbi:type II toxin-antitoxin system VapB family antitoxin [Yersinia ruckeri]|uniref:type II toxin-antitoxin system VapB family antitoxin n=1 Tax=Yersinia ruckeri TaxID=29486 RepID=UPI002238DDC9|nr:type II toxin-antitoxin system VapB family antitoxin [Yersinia ruckeri]MCW6598702.1 type II toxin-antitoxin system VapB family antitoxin [Yersinia ruckeri]